MTIRKCAVGMIASLAVSALASGVDSKVHGTTPKDAPSSRSACVAQIRAGRNPATLGAIAGNDVSLVRIQLVILAITVTLVIFAITFVANTKRATRRALKSAVKREVPAVTADLLAHLDAKLSSYDNKAAVSAKEAYGSAMQVIQAFFTCANTATTTIESEKFRLAWERLMITGSTLQIEFGDSDEVISGANNVFQLAPNTAARVALAKGINRDNISQEARDTLQKRLDELVEQAAL